MRESTERELRTEEREKERRKREKDRETGKRIEGATTMALS